MASLQKKGATSWMKHSKARGGKSSNALEIDELEIVKPFDPATAALFHWSVRAVKPDAPLSVEFVVEVHQIVGAAYQDGDKWEHKPVVQLTFEGCIPKNYTAACSGGDQLPKETIRLKVRKGKVVYQEFDETGYPIKDATDNHEFTQEEVPEGTA